MYRMFIHMAVLDQTSISDISLSSRARVRLMSPPSPISMFVAMPKVAYHARAQDLMDTSTGAAALAVIVVCYN